MMKQKRKLYGAIGLCCIPIIFSFIFLQKPAAAQVGNSTSTVGELTIEAQQSNSTIQYIVDELKNNPDDSTVLTFYEELEDDYFLILYDGGIFGAPAESKEAFYQRALEFDNGQGFPMKIEDVATVGEVKEALRVLQE